MKTIHIVAGGPYDLIPSMSEWGSPTHWVGVDRGISSMLAQGIEPDIIFGDFDSIYDRDLAFIQEKHPAMFQFPPEKDDTDLGLAFHWAMEQKPDIIRIFGNTGGRMDHAFGGVQLLVGKKTLEQSPNTKVFIIDRYNCIYAVPAGSYSIKNEKPYTYISFLPMTPEVKGITLEGFKYPLANKDIGFGSTLCISNELIKENGTFSFASGILLVIRSTD
ncbi:thiamine diphosphokinase [Bacillus sp. 1P06AnD]|uniref:thiamine diphosphokinase n=1 Tax=Bacillus sp. 1P06AnD TaxID=3132208 RepID=UPI0039A19541